VQTAAVLGREFELLILGRMLHNDSQLPRKIKTAEDAQIWATLNNIRYIFKHALLRDSAYDMQMRARLRQLHKLAAQAIEEIYTADLVPYYADLAYHYDQADMRPQAARWYRLAGQQATARYGNEEAINHFSRALKLLPLADHVGRYMVLLAREQVYGVIGNREAQFADLGSLGDHADKLNDPRRRIEVALRLTKYAHITGDFPAAIAAAQMAVTLAHPVHHQQGEAEGYLLWGRSLWRRGDFDAALPHLEKALILSREANLRHLEADALRNLGIVFNFQGNLIEAELNSERALQIYRQIGDQSGENAALNNLGEILLERGEFVKSNDYYGRALAICLQTGERELECGLRHSLGRSALQQGEYGQSQRELEHALQISYEISDVQGGGTVLTELGNLYFNVGQHETARNYFEEALHIAGEIGDQQVEGMVLAQLGLLYQRQGDTAVAWEYVQQALRVAQTIGDNATEAMALTIFGHVLLGLGRTDRALEHYREALLIRREMAQEHRAMEPLAGLAQVYLAQGDKRLAQGQALAVWHFIQQHGWAGIQEPFQVCWVCYEVLSAVGEATAVDLLVYAYDQLQTYANRLEKAEFHDSFLYRIAAHQNFLAEAKLKV
jgi:tetratricopeptide (TPR) repeat protein